MELRRHRAGETTPDLCRACKLTRDHTVMAVDADGRILRVVCGFCGSEHHYRGGGDEPEHAPVPHRPPERERMEPRMSTSTSGPPDDELDRRIRRVLREELGLTPVPLGDKWRGGELVLRPGKPGLQEKKWPLETFFNKVFTLRNLFVGGNFLLLALFLGVVVKDQLRAWKPYQREFLDRESRRLHDELAKAQTEDDKARIGRELKALSGQRVQIRQVMLPRMDRYDRFLTCHTGMDAAVNPSQTTAYADQPYAAPDNPLEGHPG